jgi:hypothetical protein
VTADFHSVVELRLGGRSLVVDPMFMIGPVDVGGAWRRGPWNGRVDGDADGGRGWLARWSTPTGNGHVYRRVGGPLDEGDVAAFLDVSVTHSGWLGGQRWRLAGVEARATVLDEPDTGPIARLHRWEGDAWHTDEVACALWSDATALAIAHLWDDHPDR